MGFPPENLKIWVDSREYSRQIQTGIHFPFTKGTHVVSACGSRLLGAFWTSRVLSPAVALNPEHLFLPSARALANSRWLSLCICCP